MDQSVINGYIQDSEYLIQAFEAVDSAVLLSHVSSFLPDAPSYIADIGAGTGRDAQWLVSLGHKVVAVEPVDQFRFFGQSVHALAGIEWINDHLPALEQILIGRRVFDFVLIVSVWQHMEDEHRKIALKNIRKIIRDGGRVALSLRNGPGAPNRQCHPVDVDGTIELAQKFDFSVISRIESTSVQQTNQAAGVTWVWLVLEAV